MVNVWRPHPVEVFIVTSIPALRLAKRRADDLIGTTEACLQASSNSAGMSGGIVALLSAQRRIHPRGNDNYCDWNLPPRGLTLMRLRLY